MLFLPASLVSRIFGMGFFSTSQRANGQANLYDQQKLVVIRSDQDSLNHFVFDFYGWL